MRATSKFMVFVAAAGFAAGLSATASDAAPRCRPSVQGSAASLGLFGVGSANARAAARANWQANAGSAYGYRYASFYRARNVRWDCKPGFILPATCVVVANPCRY
jgi:hypothetical protein